MDTQQIDVEKLRLDPENPRLPEYTQGGSQSRILKYLFENAVLDEIAASFLHNGFFDHEALLVAPESDSTFTVVEGNRRLATLMVLLQLPPAIEAEVAFVLDPTWPDRNLKEFSRIPCVVVADREAVRRALSFRHIGGLKMWSPEAKARYILEEVERTLPTLNGRDNVFTVIGRRVGSNAQGIRNPYVAIRILLYARDELELDVAWVQQHRFGVWVRLLNSADLRKHINFGDARTYEEIQAQLQNLDRRALAEVFGDLRPPKSGGKAVLSDSREATNYAAALVHHEAHDVLRKYNDLSIAKQILIREALPATIQAVANRVEVILSDVQRERGPADALPPAETLLSLARTLRTVIASWVDDERP